MPRNNSLAAALTSGSPAFARRGRPARSSVRDELWAALTGSTPAFSRRPGDQADWMRTLGEIMAEVFSDKPSRARALAGDQGHALALAFVVMPGLGRALAEEILTDLSSSVDQAIGCIRAHRRFHRRIDDHRAVITAIETLQAVSTTALILTRRLSGEWPASPEEFSHSSAAFQLGDEISALGYCLDRTSGLIDASCARQIKVAIGQARILQQGLVRDLKNVNLRDASLDTRLGGPGFDGVLWSDGTRWPEGMQEQIRARSVVTGPGTYRVEVERRTADQEAHQPS